MFQFWGFVRLGVGKGFLSCGFQRRWQEFFNVRYYFIDVIESFVVFGRYRLGFVIVEYLLYVFYILMILFKFRKGDFIVQIEQKREDGRSRGCGFEFGWFIFLRVFFLGWVVVEGLVGMSGVFLSLILFRSWLGIIGVRGSRFRMIFYFKFFWFRSRWFSVFFQFSRGLFSVYKQVSLGFMYQFRSGYVAVRGFSFFSWILGACFNFQGLVVGVGL